MADITVTTKFDEGENAYYKLVRPEDNVEMYILLKIKGVSVIHDPDNSGQLDGTGQKIVYEAELKTANPLIRKPVNVDETDLVKLADMATMQTNF